MHSNAAPAIFQHIHIYQGCWKNAGLTFQCFIFSNLGKKFLESRKTMGQICPLFSTSIRTLSPGLENSHTLKSWSYIFPTTLKYVVMLENGKKNISMYGCFSILGTKFEFMLKFHEARISECKLYKSL